jgi:biotin/methionine sulfoxide reductase
MGWEIGVSMNIGVPPNDGTSVLTGSHWGIFWARASNSRITEITPFEHDPNPTHMLQGLAESYDHATRVQRPAIRESWLRLGPGASPERRGAERFVEVGWDEALDIVASELRHAREAGGNQSIFGGSQGWSSAGQFHHAKTQLKRFLNCFGGFTDQINGYSYGAANVVVPHLVGDLQMMTGPSTSWPSIIENTTLLLSFGGIAPKNAQVLSGGCGEHSLPRWIDGLKSRGVRVISVSPIRDDMPSDLGAEWHAIVPNTDTALMLALAHTLLETGQYDGAFLERYCVGFDKVANYLRSGRDGASFDAEWAAAITQLDAAWIRTLANELARQRSFIAVSWSLQRADNGEQTYWAAMTLAAMLGQIGLPGGGIGFGYGSGAGTVGSPSRRVAPPRLPGLKNPTGSYIPASRVSDLLLHPGEPLDYNGSVITLPKTELIYWCGGNPFHHHQDLNRLVKALRRPRAFVVHESVWAPIARYADIVLPATTTLERNDISSSSKDRYLFAMHKVVPAFAEARNDRDIFVQLAERLGIAGAFTEGLDEFGWLRRMYGDTVRSAAGKSIRMPDFDEFWSAGYFRFPEQDSPFISFADFRRDPEQAPLKTPSGRIELFSDKVASFGYQECPGHAVWREPREWLGSALAKRFPLHLISNQPKHRLHSQLDPVGVSKGNKVSDREPVYINPSDAAKRGLQDGDIARLFNDRGSCLAGVVISDALRPGVVQLSTGAWFDPLDPSQAGSLDVHGSVNVLTHDHGTSRLAQGPAAHSALVEVEKYQGTLPPVKVHDAPDFATRPNGGR